MIMFVFTVRTKIGVLNNFLPVAFEVENPSTVYLVCVVI